VTSFIALYSGETVSGARLVALTADPGLVRDFGTRLLNGEEPQTGGGQDEDRAGGLRLVEQDRDNGA
jgi:hypothetical protein